MESTCESMPDEVETSSSLTERDKELFEMFVLRLRLEQLESQAKRQMETTDYELQVNWWHGLFIGVLVAVIAIGAWGLAMTWMMIKGGNHEVVSMAT